MNRDEVKRLVEENGIEFFLCSFVEMSGAPKAKVIPSTHLEDMADEGAGFGGFAAGEIGQLSARSGDGKYPRLQLADNCAVAEKHSVGSRRHVC